MASLISRGFVAASVLTISGVFAGTPLTCSNPQLSCQNTTTVSDLCCFNAPGGQLLQTQFWDSSPSTGPSDSWTVHGLWPDHCDGTFDANCDASREHSDIRNILTSFGKTDLLAYMDIYWKDSGGNDESFWSHEWNKHGTCISTLEPSCYSGYTANEEVVDFFQKTVDLFKGLDTYTILKNAGIVPSASATYTSAQIQDAIQKSFGFPVTLGCASGALDQVWYSFDVRGSVLTGTFVPTSPDGSKSTCPSTGVKYLPKSGSPRPTTIQTSSPTTAETTLITKTTPASSPTGTSGSFSGRGIFNAFTADGSQVGCLISKGTWYVGGTCATFTASASGNGFKFSSSKGTCGVSNSVFSCGSGVSATVFTALNGDLAVGGNSQFYASAVPSGSTQESVSTSSDNVGVTFQWQQ